MTAWDWLLIVGLCVVAGLALAFVGWLALCVLARPGDAGHGEPRG